MITIAERLREVRSTIERLKGLADLDQMTYRPRELNDLTIEQFADLLRLLPDATAERSSRQYRAHVTIDGMFVVASTETLADAPDVRAELNALVN